MLFVFHPGEEEGRPVSGSVLPLGAVLVCVCWPRPIQGLSMALRAWGASPWVPVVLAMNEAPDDALLLPFRRRGMGLTALHWSPGDSMPSGSTVRAQLARRPNASAAEFVDYVALRAGEKVGNLARASLTSATPGSVVRLRGTERGPFTARSWRGLIGLLQGFRSRGGGQTSVRSRWAWRLASHPERSRCGPGAFCKRLGGGRWLSCVGRLCWRKACDALAT